MRGGPRLSRRDLLRGRFLPSAPPVADAAPAAGDGVAVVMAWGCLAFRGTVCSVCVERCPVEGALRLEAGRPVVDADVCTGCGDCVDVCPAPTRAVVVRPRRNR
ncbi:MAG: 4Fe-4S dicluster domain-containing protein [Planctomycetota bacterium JB042]